MYDFFINNVKLSIALIAGGVIVFFLALYLAFGQSTGIPVSVYLIPQDATATINGKTLKPGTTHLEAGSYDVSVSKDGFTSIDKRTLTISEEHNSIDLALMPVSSEAQAWYQENIQLYADKEARASKIAAASGEEFSKDNPIVAQLPIDNLVYTIGYKRASTEPTNNDIIVTVNAMEGYRNAAIKKIKDLGYNPADFNIEFKDYRNPFL